METMTHRHRARWFPEKCIVPDCEFQDREHTYGVAIYIRDSVPGSQGCKRRFNRIGVFCWQHFTKYEKDAT